MCKCTPEIRTPFCSKPGCERPAQPSKTIGDQLREIARGVYNTNAFRAGQIEEIADDVDRLEAQQATAEIGHLTVTRCVINPSPSENDAKDAERYRRLRNQDIDNDTFPRSGVFIGRTMPDEVLTHEDADAAVDAMPGTSAPQTATPTIA